VAERAALPLLRAMHRAAKGTGRVLELGDRTMKGAQLRAALKLAGCKRADLFASDGNRRPLTFHDLRATGITWMAMRGDSPTAISERVGHQHLSTTELYLRRGRLMVAARERVFPALPRCLFGRQT
jgi:integrase